MLAATLDVGFVGCGYVRVAAGTLRPFVSDSPLCVSSGCHFGGLAGWVCAGSGLFAGVWVAVGVVAAVMCE